MKRIELGPLSRMARRIVARLLDPAVLGALDEELAEEAEPRRSARSEWADARRALQYLAVGVRTTWAESREFVRVFRSTLRVSGWAMDVRVAHRAHRARLAESLAIVVIIAGTVGVGSAAFSVVHGVLLRPLPFPEPDRIVRIWETRPDWESAESATLRSLADRLMPAAPTVEAWRDSDLGFSSIGAYVDASLVLRTPDGSEVVRAQEVDAGVFEVLGVPSLTGRTLVRTDDADGAAPVVVLSEGFWRDRLGGRPDALGETLVLDGVPRTIVGVMPAAFEAPREGETATDALLPSGRARLWIPLSSEARRGWKNVWVVARLAESTPHELAAGRLAALEAAYAVENPGTDRAARSTRTEVLLDSLVGDLRPTLWLIFAAAGVLLGVAVVNITNLLTARGITRLRELAVRRALGAPGGRLARALLIESAWLVGFGGLAGVVLAYLLVPLLVGLLPAAIPRVDGIGVTPVVLAFALGITAATALAVGIVPALLAARVYPERVLRAGGRGHTRSGGLTRLRSGLVVLEVALSVTLLIGSSLLATSFGRLWASERGFDAGGLVALRIVPDREAHRTRTERSTFLGDLDRALDALPGARASAVNSPPLSGLNSSNDVWVEHPTGEASTGLLAHISVTRPDYLAVLGVPVVRGRGFVPDDEGDTEPVALVNETLARAAWPDSNPVGARLRTLDDSTLVRTVVGVVADVRHRSLGTPVGPKVYLPAAQSRRSTHEWLIRTDGDLAETVAAAREVLGTLSPGTPLTRVLVLEEAIERSVAVPRIRALFVGALALPAVALSLLGIYGVLAFSVAERSREIGVRLALGASGGRVVREFTSSGVRLTAAGMAAGLGTALALSGLLEAFLFDVRAVDPFVYSLVSGVVLVIGALSAWLPARRAASIDPASSLQAE